MNETLFNYLAERTKNLEVSVLRWTSLQNQASNRKSVLLKNQGKMKEAIQMFSCILTKINKDFIRIRKNC